MIRAGPLTRTLLTSGHQSPHLSWCHVILDSASTVHTGNWPLGSRSRLTRHGKWLANLKASNKTTGKGCGVFNGASSLSSNNGSMNRTRPSDTWLIALLWDTKRTLESRWARGGDEWGAGETRTGFPNHHVTGNTLQWFSNVRQYCLA